MREEYPRKHEHIFLTTVLLLVTVQLLVLTGCFVGHPKETPISTQETATADAYRMEITNAVAEETETPHKTYWISEDAAAAPKPNPQNYGTTSDQAELSQVIAAAAELLGGQTLYFRPDTERLADTDVTYYRDDTILTLSWKQPINNTVYTFSEVKIAHPSQFRRFLADGTFGSGKLYLTSEMAASVNAVVASSGDYYSYRWNGVTVVNGEVKRANTGIPDNCYVDENGNLLLMTGQQAITETEVQDIVKRNNIRFSLSFGPNLVLDGKPVHNGDYAIGQALECYSRAAICQMDDLHYLLVNANAESGYYAYPTIRQFEDVIATIGCRQAYTLDGGQTATTVVNNQVFNHVSYGYERLISDIIYFATAIPDGG